VCTFFFYYVCPHIGTGTNNIVGSGQLLLYTVIATAKIPSRTNLYLLELGTMVTCRTCRTQ
jgi:hypothetical protein